MNPNGRQPAEILSSPALVAIADSMADLVDAFEGAGHHLYLVGGAVRDLLADHGASGHGGSGRGGSGRGGVNATDLDFTTAALPAEITRLVEPFASAVWTQGERFGTIGAKVGDVLVEITTHRAETYDERSRKPTVMFGRSIEDDLARRDFTINAIAVSLPGRVLVDPHGGRADLAAGVLRTPLAPEVSFTDDPLRMLRAARFLARFRLRPSPEVLVAARAGADRLAIVSAERVQAELEKQLAVDDPGPGFEFLDKTGLLDQVLPEFAALTPDARAEALAVAAADAGVLVRRAGLLVPIGSSAGGALRRLRYSRSAAKDTARLVDAVPSTLTPTVSDGTVRTVLDRIGLDLANDLIALSDAIRSHRALSGSNPFGLTMNRLAEREDLTDLEPPVRGGELIARLGLEPGPVVGEAVAFLKTRRLEDGPMTESQALASVRAWLAEATRK